LPLTAAVSRQRSPYTARPWLRRFASGAVATFHPSVDRVDRWKLVIANARGETVVTYQGQGSPPRELQWDGRSSTGQPVVPGLTYSYVFEAFDKAGNKRNFVGEGFSISAYRMGTLEDPMLVFSGHELELALVEEIASCLNQTPSM